MQFWVVKDGRATVLKLAHDEAFKAHSPGTVLTALMLRHLLDQEHVAAIDFGRGDDAYKQGWATQRRQRIGLLLVNPRRPAGSAALLRHIAGRVRGAIVQRFPVGRVARLHGQIRAAHMPDHPSQRRGLLARITPSPDRDRGNPGPVTYDVCCSRSGTLSRTKFAGGIYQAALSFLRAPFPAAEAGQPGEPGTEHGERSRFRHAGGGQGIGEILAVAGQGGPFVGKDRQAGTQRRVRGCRW